MSFSFISSNTLFAAFFIILAGSMLFTALGGSSTGSDKNTSSQCSIGFFVRNVTEASGNLILVCSQVGWTQLTGFPSGCPANQFVISVGATLTCAASPAEASSSVQCSTTGQLMRNVTETSGGILSAICVFPDWTKLINFPSGCTAGQFVTGVGITLTCSTVAWSNITGFPSACPSGQFVSAVGTSLTCSVPTGASGVSENGRFSVTYPFTVVPGLLGSTTLSDTSAFTTKSNVTLKIWYGAGFANGTSGTGVISFGLARNSSIPVASRTSDAIIVPVVSGQAIVVTSYPVNRTIGSSVASVSDNDTNPYTFRGSVSQSGVPVVRFMEIWTAFAATTTTLKINITFANRVIMYSEVSVYNNVGSFGSTVSHSTNFGGGCSVIAPCTETATLTGGLSSHVLAGSQFWFTCNDAHSEGAGQTVRSGPSDCQAIAGGNYKAESSDKPEVVGTNTYSFSLTSCVGTCLTGIIAIDLIPGVQSQGFLQIYDSTVHVVVYTQNIIVVPTAGDPLASTPLLSKYFPVGHIIVFRIAVNSASALTVSGVLLVSLLAGNV